MSTNKFGGPGSGRYPAGSGSADAVKEKFAKDFNADVSNVASITHNPNGNYYTIKTKDGRSGTFGGTGTGPQEDERMLNFLKGPSQVTTFIHANSAEPNKYYHTDDGRVVTVVEDQGVKNFKIVADSIDGKPDTVKDWKGKEVKVEKNILVRMAEFGGPGSGRYPAGSGEGKDTNAQDRINIAARKEKYAAQTDLQRNVADYLLNGAEHAESDDEIVGQIADIMRLPKDAAKDIVKEYEKAADELRGKISSMRPSNYLQAQEDMITRIVAKYEKEASEFTEHPTFCAEFSTVTMTGESTPWIECLREGEWDYTDQRTGRTKPIKVTEKTIDNMIKNFKDNVRRTYLDEDKTVPTLDIDLDHKKYDGRAVGWFGELDKRTAKLSNGKTVASLWMKPARLSPEGLKSLHDGEYRYFSVEFDDWTDPETKKTYKDVLFGGALTNRPFVKELSPIPTTFTEGAADNSKNHKKEITMLNRLKAQLVAKGVTFSEDASDELVLDKVADHITYLEEKIADQAKVLDEIKPNADKYAEIKLAEEKKAEAATLEFIKDKIAPAELKDPNSVPSKMLAEKRYDELKYFAEKLGKGFKESGKKHEEPDGDEVKGKMPWHKMAGEMKDGLIKKHMAEKEKSYAESDKALAKIYNDAYTAASNNDDEEEK